MKYNVMYYKIGNMVFRVNAPEFAENSNIAAFRCSETDYDTEYDISFVSDVHLPDSKALWSDGYLTRYDDGSITMKDQVSGNLLFRDSVSDGIHYVEFLEERRDAYGNRSFLEILDLPSKFIECGGLFIHASMIEVDGKAVLFTAEKQVGKSTQAALWKEHRGAEIVNGDRCLVRFTDNGLYAFGSPYCGTSDICLNRSIPLKAVVILSQAKENKARKATPFESLCAVMDGATYNTDISNEVGKVADLAEKIIESVPFYCLACTPYVGAVEALEAII